MLIDASSIKKPSGEWTALLKHIEMFALNKTEIDLLISPQMIESIPNMRHVRTNIIRNFFQKFFFIAKSFDRDIFCLNAFSVLFFTFIFPWKKHNLIFWVQGVLPEESYMRNKQKKRFFFLSLIEFLALKFANHVICVSAYMKTFLENKYHLKMKNCIILHCISSFSNNASAKIDFSFVYIGFDLPWCTQPKNLGSLSF